VTAPSEADRLRRCRELFERAQTANVTMQEAQRREREARWAEIDARLAAKRAGALGELSEAAETPQPWWRR
jgi:hypothetical protein